MEADRRSPNKLPVKVRADHHIGGCVVPLMFRPEEGEAARIDAVLDVRKAPALKAGGQGTRYLVRVREDRLVLFHDSGQWFIEID